MATKLYNLAGMTTVTAGPGTITLRSAIPSFLTFDRAGVQDGETISYKLEDSNNNREIGYGTYNAAAKTLIRTVLKSTNNDNPINLSGRAKVMIVATAENIDLQGPKGEKGDHGEIAEAPMDGIAYQRRNGAWIPLTYATVALTVDRALGAVGAITDVLSLDVGSEGQWFVSANATVGGHTACAYIARIWDGTTIIADSSATSNTNWPEVLSLNGVITDPAGPIKLSCVGLNIASAVVRANFYSGNFAGTTKQTQLTALRIG